MENRRGWAWSLLTVRWILGLIFLMAGWWKCFELNPVGHARQFFLEWFAQQWIPSWLLWPLGVTIPVVELVAGALVCLGLLRHWAYVALGAILVTVTYGHLLLEPLFDTTGHIFPRLVLLVFVWVAPARLDVFSADEILVRFRNAPPEPAAGSPPRAG